MESEKIAGAERPEVTLLYLGVVEDREQTMHAYWVMRPDGGGCDPLRLVQTWVGARFYKKKVGYGQPGTFWRVQYEPGPGGGFTGSLFPKTAVYSGQWEDAEVRRALQARSHAEEARIRAEKKARKEAMAVEWREALDPIRWAYQRAKGGTRAQIVAQVVAYITG